VSEEVRALAGHELGMTHCGYVVDYRLQLRQPALQHLEDEDGQVSGGGGGGATSFAREKGGGRCGGGLMRKSGVEFRGETLTRRQTAAQARSQLRRG